MYQKPVASTLIAAFSLVLADSCLADDIPMEKCKITDANGKGLIKPGMGDCAGSGSSNSCAGANAAGDPSAWIYLAKGVCGKITGGSVCK